MIWNIKIIYLLSLGAVLTPTAMQWSEEIKIPHKQALLPPEMPYTSEKNEKQLQQLLAHDLWDKSHPNISGDITQGDQLSSAEAMAAEKEKNKNLSWKLQGIGYQEGVQSSVVISTEKQSKIYYENDPLPDGAQLKKIAINSIEIIKNGEQSRVYLFKEN